MVRDRAGRTACHRLLERPQAPLCLGAQTAPSHPTSSRYRSNAESRIDLADAPLTVRYVAAGMIGLAVLAYVLALVLGALPEKAHIDFAAIVLIIIAVAGVTLL